MVKCLAQGHNVTAGIRTHILLLTPELESGKLDRSATTPHFRQYTCLMYCTKYSTCSSINFGEFGSSWTKSDHGTLYQRRSMVKFWMNKEKFTRAGFEPATSGLTCRSSTN